MRPTMMKVNLMKNIHKGAEAAYEIIINAFARGNRKTLNHFLKTYSKALIK